jgi:hypothetical protein
MTTPPTSGPRAWFTSSQRLFRGYGPLAVFALMLLLMSVLVPSRVPDQTETVAADGSGTQSTTGPTSGTTGGTASGVPTADGETTTETDANGGDGNGGDGGEPAPEEGGGEAPAQAAGAQPCPDRDEQVPGDPYSPPCVVFQGQNPGATHRGVNDESIIVSYRVLNERGFQQTLAELAGASLVDTPQTIQRTVSALADYFNQRFEFYGRNIQIAFYNGRGSNTTELLGGGRDNAEADAIEVAEQIGAFADLSATSEPYAGALAARGVIGFGTPYLSRNWHEERAPFAWSLAVDGTRVSELAAEYRLQKLQGGNADHAGGDLQGQPRKFGTIAPENTWYQESVENAQRIIREAGHDPGLNVKYVLDLSTMSNQATNIIAQLKREGITTVVCGCDPIIPVFLSGVANRERYYPEFIIAGTALTDADIVGQLWQQNFARHAFGVSPLNEFVPPTQTIAYAAYKSVRDDEPAFSVDLIYYQMYILAIGLQGAGPDLNPQTFEQGMFAYPERTGPVGTWGFGPGNRTGTNDVREIYWDPDAISGFNGQQGAYISPTGERWLPGQIPGGEPGRPRS